MEHPSTRDLLDLQILEKGILEAGLGMHMASCDQCRDKFMAVLAFERRIGEAFPEGTLTSECPKDWEIAALIAKEAYGERAFRISSHVGVCPVCTDRASEYFKALVAYRGEEIEAPEEWKKVAVRALTERNDQPMESEVTVFSRIRDFLERIVAVMPPLPGYAAAAFAVALLAWFVVIGKERILIIPSSEKITYREINVHGSLGFMGSVEQYPVSGMVLSSYGDVVVFHWEPFEKVERSNFFLEVKATRESVFSKSGIEREEVSVPRGLIEEGKVYTWRIEGKTKGGRDFEYTGDVLHVK